MHEVLIVARENHQVTQEHVSFLLTCVQELIAEINQVQPLGREFREKYIGIGGYYGLSLSYQSQKSVSNRLRITSIE